MKLPSQRLRLKKSASFVWIHRRAGCEHGDERFDSTKGVVFLEALSCYQLLCCVTGLICEGRHKVALSVCISTTKEARSGGGVFTLTSRPLRRRGAHWTLGWMCSRALGCDHVLQFKYRLCATVW
jgi:hypothetical protein